jgi:hypothetical protein
LSSWHSYPSSYNIGHRVLRDFFDHEIIVEEKVDGSQFSFGKFPTIEFEADYELRVRSKGAVFPIDAPPKMFKAATDTVLRLAPLLTLGYTYRGEFLSKPKHNSLAYNRTPLGHIILFDVCREEEDYLSYEEKAAEALRLGLECVPKLFEGKIESPVPLRDFFQLESVLGGQKIEGVVCKPKARNVFGTDKKLLLGKFVSEAFKEVHSKTWGEANPHNKTSSSSSSTAIQLPRDGTRRSLDFGMKVCWKTHQKTLANSLPLSPVTSRRNAKRS